MRAVCDIEASNEMIKLYQEGALFFAGRVLMSTSGEAFFHDIAKSAWDAQDASFKEAIHSGQSFGRKSS